MHVVYQHDPALQLIRETDVAKFFRAETGYDCLVTYFHGYTGRWVLAAKEDNRMIDIALLGDGSEDGAATEECTCTREHAANIVWLVKNMVSRHEAKQKAKEWERTQRRMEAEVDQDRDDFHHETARMLWKMYGRRRAEQYANTAGIKLVDRTVVPSPPPAQSGGS